jgi:hypothetical protein
MTPAAYDRTQRMAALVADASSRRAVRSVALLTDPTLPIGAYALVLAVLTVRTFGNLP